MQDCRSAHHGRRGITVLALLLLVIAVIIAAIFLVRYLRSPAPVQSSRVSVATRTDAAPAYFISRLIS
jgi:flagellar biogenesis protein FliO